MQLFEEKEVEIKEIEPTVVDNSAFIKRNLMKSVTRSGAVYSAIEAWLYSFGGALSKKSFERQMKRLDWDDTIALTQLAKAKGRRIIPLPPPPKKPALTKPLIEQMVESNFVAIYGRKFKSALKNAIDELKSMGTVYVLSIEQLILEFKSYREKGNSPQMIEKAIACDFLFIVDLEMTIHLEWHINEAIERIGRFRAEAKKPIISTWNRFNDCNGFFSTFDIFIVE